MLHVLWKDLKGHIRNHPRHLKNNPSTPWSANVTYNTNRKLHILNMNCSLLALLGILAFTSCMNSGETVTEIGSPEAKNIVAKLNDWNKDEVQAYEAESRHEATNLNAAGETRAFIAQYKELLRKLGFVAEWDQSTREYRLRRLEQNPASPEDQRGNADGVR